MNTVFSSFNHSDQDRNELPIERPEPAAQISRRDFVALATKTFLAFSGLLGLSALLKFLGHRGIQNTPTEFDLGAPIEYPLDSTTMIDEANAVLMHTPEGFKAFSLVCPHLGCTAKADEGNYICPCHSSRFDGSGKLMKGPADKDLGSLQVEQNDQGHLVLRI